MGGGRVQREIVPNSLYSLLFYFELFPKIMALKVSLFTYIFQNMFVVSSYHWESSNDFKICLNKEMVHWVQLCLKVPTTQSKRIDKGLWKMGFVYYCRSECHIYKGIQICDPRFIPKYWLQKIQTIFDIVFVF